MNRVRQGWAESIPRSPVGTGGVLLVGLLLLTLPGCLAQKADVKRMKGALDKRITDLDQREKDLNKKIAIALDQIEQQGKKAEQGVREARARLKHDITQLREKVGSLKEGDLAEQAHRLGKLGERVDNLTHRNETLSQLVMKQKSDTEERLTQVEQQQTSQFNALKADQHQLQTQLGQVQENLRNDIAKTTSRVEALGPTLEALAKKMDTQLDQQDQSISTTQDHMNQQIGQLDEQTRVLDEQTRALNERVSQFAQTLPEFKRTLAAFGERLVQEDEKVAELTQQISGQSTAMRSKLDTDTKNVASRLNALTKKVDADLHAITTHLAQVTKKVEADLQAQSSHLEKVTKKVDADGKAMQGHLAEVNRSVTSVAQALKTMSATILDRVDSQDHKIEQMMEALQRVTTEVNTLRSAGGQVGQVQPNRNRKKRSSGRSGNDVRPQKPSLGLSTTTAGSSGPSSDIEKRLMEQKAVGQYEQVMSLFKQGNLDRARQGFTEFLMTYPSSLRAPNAQYWLAECLYGDQQYLKAIEAYKRVETKYPDSDKVPAALLKQGFAYLALQDKASARSNLERVLQRFPQTPEASKAAARLQQLQALQ